MVRVAGKGYVTGRVGQGQAHGVLRTELRFVDGWDTQILEQVQAMEKCGLEFQYGVTWSVTAMLGTWPNLLLSVENQTQEETGAMSRKDW